MPEKRLAYTWAAILEQVRSQVPEAQFRTWFVPARPGATGRGVFTIRVPNEYFREWLGREYLAVIKSAISAVTGEKPRVRIVVDPTIAAPHERGAGALLTGLDSDPRLNPNYTFGNFVVGAGNRLAYTACVAVAAAVGARATRASSSSSEIGAYNPLLLHGGAGQGKTHLLHAVCHKLTSEGKGQRVLFTSSDAFIGRFVSAVGAGKLEAFRRQCRRPDVLVMDDVQGLCAAPQSQEEFFHTFNALLGAGKQMVIASAGAPDSLSGMEARMTSRLKSGLVARLDPLTVESRRVLTQRKAARMGWQLPEDVVSYVASRREASSREIEGAVIRIVGYAALSKRPVDLELARVAIGAPLESKQPTVEQLIRIVCDHFGVTAATLRSPRRTRSLVWPRQIYMFLARKMTNCSLDEIGASLGDRDHTTIMYGVQKIEALSRRDARLRKTISLLRERSEQITSIASV